MAAGTALQLKKAFHSIRPLRRLVQLVVEAEPGSEEPPGGQPRTGRAGVRAGTARTIARYQQVSAVRIRFRLEFLKDNKTKLN